MTCGNDQSFSKYKSNCHLFNLRFALRLSVSLPFHYVELLIFSQQSDHDTDKCLIQTQADLYAYMYTNTAQSDIGGK